MTIPQKEMSMGTKLYPHKNTFLEFNVPDLDEDISRARKKGKHKKLARLLKAQSCPHDNIVAEWTVCDYWAFVCDDCRIELFLRAGWPQGEKP